MATIPKDYGTGGSGFIGKGPSGSRRHPAIADVLRDMATDLATLRTNQNSMRTAVIATQTKLDADAGVTDTNYAATNPPPAAIGALLTQIGD